MTQPTTKSTERRPSGIKQLDVVGVHEAKTHLSRLLERVEGGEQIEIARRGEVVARLVPATTDKVPVLGLDVGSMTVPENFDDPLPEELLGGWCLSGWPEGWAGWWGWL